MVKKIRKNPIVVDHSESSFEDLRKYSKQIKANMANQSNPLLSAYVEEEIDNDETSRAFIDINLDDCSFELYEQWCKKEEKVIDSMSGYKIESVINKIRKRQKWNIFFHNFRIPFRFNIGKLQVIFQSYLEEYLLRLHGLYDSEQTDPITYDIYRGMRPKELSIDTETYKKEYQKELDHKNKNRGLSLIPSFFKKVLSST